MNKAMGITEWMQARMRELEMERDAYKAALTKLVQLKIGPKDSVYYREKPQAWQEAADLLGIDTVIFP